MFLLMELKNIFRWDKMRDMTWCKLYTHLSWSWCMKKPNSGNSGVRNIVHSALLRCTIFHTPLLSSLFFFFIHNSQERCVLVFTHLSWEWCMKKPDEDNSGVRNIVHLASPRCTIFRTPLLPSLGFFIHHSQERCVYTKNYAVQIVVWGVPLYFGWAYIKARVSVFVDA